MITGDYHHTAIAVARGVGMVSPSAKMILIDTVQQSHSQQNRNGPNHQGQGQSADIGPSHTGLDPEADGEDGGHSLEAQLSMAQSMLGHNAGWGLNSDKEEESQSPEQKLNLGSAPADGASQEKRAGQNALASNQVAHSAVSSTEATQEGASEIGRVGHWACALKVRHVLQTERSHKELVVPAFAAPVPHSSMLSGDADVCSFAQLSSCMSQHILDGPPEATAPVQGGRSRPGVRRLQFQFDLAAPPYGDPSRRQGTNDDHREIHPPALGPATRQHRPLRLLIPSSQHRHCTSDSLPKHGSSSSPGLRLPPSVFHSGQGCPAPASPSQQPLQKTVRPFSDCRPSSQHFARHSSQYLNPFRGLLTADGSGCGPPLDPSQTPLAAPKPSLASLRFLQVPGNQNCEGSWALSALAEGQLQCAVTGDALKLMLQLPDTSLLEAVMRNAVVFARMKPHQKGQVMHLLGTVGLHQLFDGRHRHIQVCRA